MTFSTLSRWVMSTVCIWTLASCAVPSGVSGPSPSNDAACEGSPELITDPRFAMITEVGSLWQYRQHAGARSFSVEAEDGVLIFKRVGPEPWATFRQSITDERLDGATIRFTADLQGDVSPDVTHGFGAKAGLFLQIGRRPDAFMGDQDPGTGQWDWQSYSVTETLPVGVQSVNVGFIHQAGEGAIEARNPSLVLVNCLD
ncbi:hypothetical protein N9E47_08300 [Luminiphilus sp.]|nr:hypothetical protein [Luminiphilus sp.]